MNGRRILVVAAVGLCAALGTYACGDGATEPPPPTPDPPRPASVAVAPATVQLTALGATEQLTAEVRDQNGNAMAGAAVSWSSSAAAVATVSNAGLVTAAGNGTATITATAGSASGSATVTVAQEVSAVAVTPAVDTLVAGDTLRLAAEATDANGRPVAGAEFEWASSDTLVAVVGDPGLVTGVGAGEAEVTATAAGITGRAALTVVAPAPTTVAVTPDTVALTALGQTAQLDAEVRDQAGRAMEDVRVSWSSADTTIAAVDSAGLVTAIGGGATTIAATAGEVSGTAVVTVMQSAGSVVVSPAADTVALGDTLRLAAAAFDENGQAVPGAEFRWSSSDGSVASVDGTGLVTGVAEGTATITATAGDARGTAEITVENPDRAALVALYNATDGPNWVNDENWLTDAPLGEWYGVETDASGRVFRLDLSGNDDNWPEVIPHGLSGQIPSELGNLSGLTRLDLAFNDLTGPIPPQLGNLANLYELVFDGNDFTGSIPPELGNLANLAVLALRRNHLTGAIPPELGNLANLGSLKLSSNSLTGPIPPELGGLSRLGSLLLGFNDLTGPIPPQLGNLANLYELVLDGNDLTGSIPPELGNLTNVGILSLWDTGLSGSIPPELGNLTNVWYLRLLNNDLSGPIPPELGDMANLSLLRLDWNDLTGPIPPELGKLEDLIELVLSHNRLTGPIPPRLGSLANLEHLNLGANRLTGPIPPELGSLTNLESLSLAFNRLTGPVPTELGNLAALTNLALNGNNVTGEFPAFLLRLPRLHGLFLGTGFCAPADPGIRARLNELHTDLSPCPDPSVRLLPSVLMREDGNGMSLALPDDLRTAVAVTVSDPSVVAASVADGWLTLSPRRIGSADVKVSQAAGGDNAIAHVDVREAVGTFGIDILVDQPVPFGYAAAMVEAADWWSYILDGTEWPDREAGCPTSDPFGGKVRALADELLVATRIEELDHRIAGYAAGCFFPVGGGREAPALDPGGGYVVMGGFGSQGLLRHEIGHLLGLVLWRSEAGLATSDCRFFTGPHAVKAFRDGGGDPDLPGVPIQTDCGSHWHEDIVDYELMGPSGGWDANSISLGALVDAGYTVDLSKALPWPWGRRAAALTVGEELGRDVVLGEPRVFIERRPREPPR